MNFFFKFNQKLVIVKHVNIFLSFDDIYVESILSNTE